MPTRVGIIGCGGIARSHVRAYKEHGAEIVGVSDCSIEASKKLAEEAGGVPANTDFREMLETVKPEIVSICTPPVAHEEAAVFALEHGIHVLCEKPMAFDADAAHRMQAAAEKSKALLMPAFRHRFLPANIALRDLVASGTIGDVVFFNNIFCGPAFAMEGKWFTQKAISGGGTLLDTNSHSVDLFRFIIGEIVDQKAVMHRHFKTTDVEDAGILAVKAANGAAGSIQSAFVAGVGLAFIDILGTKGQAVYDYLKPDVVRYRLTRDADWTSQPVTPSNGFSEQIGHFLGAIRGEHALSCTVQDGVRCMEVIDAVY